MEDARLLAFLESNPLEGRQLLEALYREPVRLAALQRLGSTPEVEDCVKETFQDFYAKRGQFDPAKGSLRGYLITIATRKAILRWRELQRKGKRS